MAENLEEEFLNLYNEMLRILVGVNSVNQHCINFDEKWRLNLTETLKSKVRGSQREFENQKSKIMRKECKCIFIGETSAGKSTLINAILGRSDLPRRARQVTNSFVQIKKTSNSSSYFIINNDTKKRDIGTLKNFVTFTSQTCVPSGSHVDLYYTEEDCPFIRPNMVLIDTPGIDTDESIDKKTLSYCRGADLIVLVVNSTITLSNRIQRFVNDFKTLFSNLNIIIVYNHSDQLDDEDDPEINIAQLKQHANSFFKDVKNARPEYARKRTFFVSAKEEMAIGNTNNNEARKIEFSKFKELLIGEISVSSIERRIRYLNELYDILKNIIKENRYAINEIINGISIISTNVVCQLKQIPNLNKDISDKISKTMNPLYNEFRECALREVRRERDEETKMKRVEDAVRSVIDRGLREIKLYVTDKIRENKNTDCLRVIEKMYFPEYLEIFPSSETVREGQTFDFNLRTGGTAAFTLGGVALGVAAAIARTPVAIPLLIGGLLITFLSGKSVGSIINDRNSNQDEHEIKIIWNELVNSTKQSFSKFLEEISTKLPNYFAAEVQLRKLGEYEKKIEKYAQRFEELNEFY